MSLREFARLIGVSDTAVRKAIKAGRLAKSLGKSADGHTYIVDFETAEAEWAATTKTAAGVRTRVRTKVRTRRRGSHPGSHPSSAAPPSSEPDPPTTGETAPESLQEVIHPERTPAISASTLIEAQRIATLERARKLKLENDLEEGRLVAADIAAKEAFEAARIIREAVLNVPARIAGELAAETEPARVQLRLEAALREALTATADELVAVNE